MSKTRSNALSAGMLVLVGVVAVSAIATVPRAQEGGETGTQQAVRGQKLFEKHCAKCHGNEGQGTKKAPPVVGKDAFPVNPRPTQKLRKMQFHTAQDVAKFVSTKMPLKKPGSLTTDEYYDILAFDLKANGVDVSNKKIDPTTAAAINLH